VLNSLTEQLNVGALQISSGGSLTIRPSIAQVLIRSSLDVAGTLNIDPSSSVNITVGGNIIIENGGIFQTGKSTITANGAGLLRGTFYNMIVTEVATLQSAGNTTILNSLLDMGDITMRQQDTMTIRNPAGSALSGQGLVSPGTIKRLIAQNSLDVYQFESPVTYIRYYGVGTYPDSIYMTTYADTLPPYVPDSVFAMRFYTVTPMGGGTTLPAALYLRFDPSESDIDVTDMGLFRDSSGIIFNEGVDNFYDSYYSSVGLDSTILYNKWYIGEYDYTPVIPYEFTDFLIVADNGHHSDTLTWGAIPGATDGIDPTYGEVALGPKPPIGTFDARWLLSDSATTLTDFRNILHDSILTTTYECEFQPGPGGYPITLQWDSTMMPLGSVLLQDSSRSGSKSSVNMKLSRSFKITDTSIHAVFIIHQAATFYAFNKGWNLMSMPLALGTSPTVAYNFPDRSSSVYAYNNGYLPVDSLSNGVGYWIKFPLATTVGIEGNAITSASVLVQKGWNIVGSVSKTIPFGDVTAVPSGILAASPLFFGYANGYVPADSISPSKGYWIKVSGAGTLNFTAGHTNTARTANISEYLSKFNSITVTDQAKSKQTLYFGNADSTSNNFGSFEMPPHPPTGILDVRFGSQQLLEIVKTGQNQSVDLPVSLGSSSYPLVIGIDVTQKGVQSVTLLDRVGGKVLGIVARNEKKQFVVSNSSQHSVVLHIEYRNAAIPVRFGLEQNYPNPFNPTTTIQFELPLKSFVTLKVYNILGQQIETLADHQEYAPGTYSAVFDGSKFASGVYFYRISAFGSDQKTVQFNDVKKFVLVK
jgi:hypothetical protein